MTTIILNWILFVFLVLLFLLSYIAFWAFSTSKNEQERKGMGLFIILCGIIAAIMFVPATNTIGEKASVIVWKLLAFISGVTSIIVTLIKDKIPRNSKPYLWCSISTVLISIIPFVIDISIQQKGFNNTDFKNQYIINPYLLISTTSLLIVMFTLVIFFLSNKVKQVLEQQDQLLKQNIQETDKERLSSFIKPYDKMLREDFLYRINQLENKITDIVKTNEKNVTNNSSKASLETTELEHIHNRMNEMQKLLLLLNSQMSNKTTINLDIIRDLNHFFATPFATIIANAELLNNNKGIDKTCIEKINNSIQLCKCIIETYRECMSFSDNHENIINSLKHTLETAFHGYAERNDKNLKPLNTNSIPEKFMYYNNHYIVSIVLPLLENAIQAAPNNTEIEIIFDNNNQSIRISNFCINTPNKEDLKTPGYSSKKNHKGTGIIIVQNLLSMKNRGSLDTVIENNKVIQIIKLNNNDSN